ncbi:MAG: YeaC family protein [Saccharospirillum sp.]
MNFDDVAASLTPEVYQRLKESIELGRWPTGQALTREQKALCLEALLKYEVAQGIPETQRIGYIERPNCATDKPSDVQPIRMPGSEALQ